MKRIVLALLAANFLGCYAEFDLGVKSPRRDPCTGEVTKAYIHVMPACRLPPPPNP